MNRRTKAMTVLLSLFSIQIYLYSLLRVQSTPSNSATASPFFIIIDGGSTGSRLHIYEFIADAANVTHCVRRGSARVNIPLSHPDHRLPAAAPSMSAHIMPLFEYAAELIPPEFHSTTDVKIQATAGMRLLDETLQSTMYDALYQGLVRNDSFVFSSLQRSDIGTLSGTLEGFYGVVAANYLQGNIDSFLNITTRETQGLSGSLDMGGSSTQIVYFASTETETENLYSVHDIGTYSNATSFFLDEKLHPRQVVSISHLSFGVDQFKQRLLDLWIQDNFINNSSIIFNPCHFKGYTSEYNNFTFIGTGNATLCNLEINRLMPHEPTPHYSTYSSSSTQERTVGGVQYPPTLQGKFIAMSLYYFTLDCLRELSSHEPLKQSWPSPSIHDLATSLDSLCSRSWPNDLQLIQHDAHIYTRAEVLPDRCFESVYMVSLLRDGYGFHPSSKDITFAYHVQGSEVEWSLGMALSLFAQEQHGFTWGPSNTSMKSLSQFLSDIIAHVPHWVSAMSYQEISVRKGHFLIL